MGKILVLYHSQNGSTAAMAKLVGEGAEQIPNMHLRVLSITEAASADVHWCDGIAVGSPTHFGTISGEMKMFWEGLLNDWLKLDGKIGCAFSSSGAWGGGAELTCQTITTVLMNFGFLTFGLTDYVGQQFTAHYGATQAGHPRLDKEHESCRRLGRRLAEWIAVLVDKDLKHHPLQATYPRGPGQK